MDYLATRDGVQCLVGALSCDTRVTKNTLVQKGLMIPESYLDASLTLHTQYMGFVNAADVNELHIATWFATLLANHPKDRLLH